MKSFNIDQYACIGMREFLMNYANLDGYLSIEQIFKLESAKATHQDLTELGIPYLKRVPLEIVTEEDILCGDIIIVNDFKGCGRKRRVAPYKRPELVRKEENKEYGTHIDVRKKELRW